MGVLSVCKIIMKISFVKQKIAQIAFLFRMAKIPVIFGKIKDENEEDFHYLT
jgi:hypothetical protein